MSTKSKAGRMWASVRVACDGEDVIERRQLGRAVMCRSSEGYDTA